MSIQSNFPNLQPSLLLDFANTKQLDNRVTFTRSTPSVYYDGKTTAMAEQNTVLYSQDIANGYWTKYQISLSSATAPDGTSTASTLTEATTDNNHAIWTTAGPIVTNTDISSTFSIYAKAGTCSTFAIQIYRTGVGFFIDFDLTTVASSIRSGTGTSSITAVGGGWYRCTATSSSLGSNTWQFEVYMTLTYGGVSSYLGTGRTLSLWGVQAEQRNVVTAYTPTTTQAITNYIPVLLSAGGNQARFDCNPTTGESLGLLIEEQRTNSATYSGDLGNNSAWPPAGVITTSNVNVAPDGSLSAMSLVSNTSGGDHNLYRLFGLSATAYTFSVYAKYSGENLALSAGASATSGVPWTGCIFDLQNGIAKTPQGSGITCTPNIQSVGNGWYRCSITFTPTSASYFLIISTTNNVNATMNTYGFIVYTGNSWNGVQLWGCQLEVGAFASSYIPTTGAAATRTADVAQISGTNLTSWYSQGNGTFYAEASTASVAGDVMILEGTNSTNGFLDVSMTFATTSTQFINRFTSLNSDMRKTSAVSANTMVKFSGIITSSLGTTLSATNGSAATAVGSFTANFGADRMFIGSRGGSALFLNAPIRKLAFYPAQLTQTQQNSITG